LTLTSNKVDACYFFNEKQGLNEPFTGKF